MKNLVSEAPLQEVSGIPMPTLEKLLVDILRDSDFFYLQGSESERFIENAFKMYSVNRSRLFRYSSRRKVKEELLSILNNSNLQRQKNVLRKNGLTKWSLHCITMTRS